MLSSIARVCGLKRAEVAFALNPHMFVHMDLINFLQLKVLVANLAGELLARVMKLVVVLDTCCRVFFSADFTGHRLFLSVGSFQVNAETRVVLLAFVALFLLHWLLLLSTVLNADVVIQPPLRYTGFATFVAHKRKDTGAMDIPNVGFIAR